MSLEEFWQNVRRSAQFNPPSAEVEYVLHKLGKEADTLLSLNLWISTVTVRGYDEKDFAFLTADERQRLTAAVSQFRTVAEEVNPRGSATPEQVEQAQPAFQQVVEMLEFDRFEDVEAFRIGKEIERRINKVRPQHLDRLRYRTGLDSTSDPALWIWVFVAETGEYDDTRFLERANAIEAILEPIAREVAPEGRVYLHFRSTSDLPEAQEILA
jgi:hypothetical protein